MPPRKEGPPTGPDTGAAGAEVTLTHIVTTEDSLTVRKPGITGRVLLDVPAEKIIRTAGIADSKTEKEQPLFLSGKTKKANHQ